jgi:hypothetical protein
LSQRSFFLWVLRRRDDVQLAMREVGNDAVHEAEKLDRAAPLGMCRDDPSGSDFVRREQSRDAVLAVQELWGVIAKMTMPAIAKATAQVPTAHCRSLCAQKKAPTNRGSSEGGNAHDLGHGRVTYFALGAKQ